MLTRDMLKYFAQGAGANLDFTGLLNSDLYNIYRTEASQDIDARNLASDWRAVEFDLCNAMLQLALENDEAAKKFLELIEIQNKAIETEGQANGE